MAGMHGKNAVVYEGRCGETFHPHCWYAMQHRRMVEGREIPGIEIIRYDTQYDCTCRECGQTIPHTKED
jgi:hypothetical protein